MGQSATAAGPRGHEVSSESRDLLLTRCTAVDERGLRNDSKMLVSRLLEALALCGAAPFLVADWLGVSAPTAGGKSQLAQVYGS
jgi:hypothetical protein